MLPHGQHSGMALSEVGRHDTARPRIERSLAQFWRDAYAAHACADLRYKTGGRTVTSSNLAADLNAMLSASGSVPTGKWSCPES